MKHATNEYQVFVNACVANLKQHLPPQPYMVLRQLANHEWHDYKERYMPPCYLNNTGFFQEDYNVLPHVAYLSPTSDYANMFDVIVKSYMERCCIPASYQTPEGTPSVFCKAIAQAKTTVTRRSLEHLLDMAILFVKRVYLYGADTSAQ